MSNTLLFALDKNTDEVIVSESAKGSNKIYTIERIAKKDCEALYYAVVTLSTIASNPNIDAASFKAIDKACQVIYSKYRGA